MGRIKVNDHVLEELVKLGNAGFSAAEIKRMLDPPVGVRQINRLMRQYCGPRQEKRPSGRKPEDNISGALRDIVTRIMIDRGDDPFLCARCGKKQNRPCDIHHTRYAGATINDLIFLCRSCNCAPENKGLQ